MENINNEIMVFAFLNSREVYCVLIRKPRTLRYPWNKAVEEKGKEDKRNGSTNKISGIWFSVLCFCRLGIFLAFTFWFSREREMTSSGYSFPGFFFPSYRFARALP